MSKKKTGNSDKPATQGQIESLIELIQESFGFLVGEMRKMQTGLNQNVESIRIEFDSFRKEQRDHNKEVSQKIDVGIESTQALDKRVRYQDDMPERLEHVESQQYELTRRVAALEEKR